MHITHGKTIHLVGMDKPKEAQLQSPVKPTQLIYKSSSWSSRELSGQVSAQPDSWGPLPSVPACPIRSE